MNGHAGDLPTKGMGAGGCPDQKVDPSSIRVLHELAEQGWRRRE